VGELLSKPMVTVLRRMASLQDRHGYDGMYPYGAGRWRTFRALDRAGLCQFVGHGRDEDGPGGGPDVPVYEITDAGREALAKHDSLRPSPGDAPVSGKGGE
jgi:hypothetical protein